MYKSKGNGGLEAIKMGVKLKIAFCKKFAQALVRNAIWTKRQKIKGSARH